MEVPFSSCVYFQLTPLRNILFFVNTRDSFKIGLPEIMNWLMDNGEFSCVTHIWFLVYSALMRKWKKSQNLYHEKNKYNGFASSRWSSFLKSKEPQRFPKNVYMNRNLPW